MRPVNVFQLEMKSVFSDRRSFLLRIGISFLLGFPFVLTAMPVRVQVTGLLMLVIFISFFAAAVGMARRKSDGHLGRLMLLPLPFPVLYGDLLLVGAFIDLLQVGPVFCLYLAVNGRQVSIGAFFILFAMLMISLIVLNLLGMLVGSAARSNQEVHLFAALGTGIIALMSGIIPAPGRLESYVNGMAAANPLTETAKTLTEITSGTATSGIVEVTISCIFILAAGCMVIARSQGKAYDTSRNSMVQH